MKNAKKCKKIDKNRFSLLYLDCKYKQRIYEVIYYKRTDSTSHRIGIS